MWCALIVEDDQGYREALQNDLMGRFSGIVRSVTAGDVASARAALSAQPVDLVLLDISIPLSAGSAPDSRGGIQLLADLPALAPDALAVVLSGQDRRQAVELLMSRRVDAYLFKDFSFDEIAANLQRIFESLELRRSRRLLKAGVDRSVASPMVAVGPAMQQVVTHARQVAVRSTNVLLTGDSGTGKEVLARFIHAESARARAPFVALSCAAIPEGLAEVELFGAAKGSYTGQDGPREGVMSLARGGTLFLDEIGELPLVLQPKLLRALQERQFRPLGAKQEIGADFRLVCATHRDLTAAVAAGTFREDLLYRIQVFPLRLPPLRERLEDLPHLVSHYVERFNREMGRRIRGVTTDAMALLTGHSWPGNVRELGNVIEYAFVVEQGDEIETTSLPALSAGASPTTDANLGYEEAHQAWERGFLERTLARCEYRLSLTAEKLRIPRRTLQDRLTRLGIRVRGRREP